MKYAGWVLAVGLAIGLAVARRVAERRLEAERVRLDGEIAASARETSAQLDDAEKGIRERERLLAEETATCTELRARRVALEKRERELRRRWEQGEPDREPGDGLPPLEPAEPEISLEELEAAADALRERLSLVRRAVGMVSEEAEL